MSQPTDPTPPSPDALQCSECDFIAQEYDFLVSPVPGYRGCPRCGSSDVYVCEAQAADALEAFRAVAEALLRCEGVTLSTPRRSEVCTYCSAPARHRKGSTCPVALARAAMERFPEVTK